MQTFPFAAALSAALPTLAADEEFNLSLTGGNTSTYVWVKTEGTTSAPYVTLKAKKGSLNPELVGQRFLEAGPITCDGKHKG